MIIPPSDGHHAARYGCTTIEPFSPEWRVQWKLIVPAVFIATGTSAALVGAILPVSKAPGDVAVCGLVSLFFQFTLCPIFTVRGLGEYTPLVMKMVTRESGPDGLAVFDESPHPAAAIVASATTDTRMKRAADIGRMNSIDQPPEWEIRAVPTRDISVE
jgi:hypothetical protein